MKIIFILAVLILGSVGRAGVDTITVSGKVVSFDGKIVVMEIAGENFKFDRKKLGKEFASLKQGDAVEMRIDKKNLVKSKN